MTFRKWVQQYNHYKDDYDFKLSGKTYAELSAKSDEEAVGMELPG